MSSKSAEKTQRVDPTLEKHDPADFANGKAPPPMDGERRGSRWASVSQGRNKGYEEEDPFGDEENGEEGDVKYKTLEWWQAGMIMIAETISLGILSLPSVLAVVGLVPGFLIILGLGVLATYSGYVIGQFKQEYPWVCICPRSQLFARLTEVCRCTTWRMPSKSSSSHSACPGWEGSLVVLPRLYF